MWKVENLWTEQTEPQLATAAMKLEDGMVEVDLYSAILSAAFFAPFFSLLMFGGYFYPKPLAVATAVLAVITIVSLVRERSQTIPDSMYRPR